jgi:RNA polymerase sigma-70 factor (ECF subfamily)
VSTAASLPLRPVAGTVPAVSSVEDDEAALVERVRRGDPGAFDSLVSQYMRRAFAVSYRLLGNREDAEDLVQEAFMAVLRKIDSFERGRAFAPWFFRILVNRGLNARKSRALRTTDALPEHAVSAGASPERSAERAELRGRLRTAMDGLPERQRVIVELFELEGFAGPEIAEILEISDGTVRWHLHEARKTLRQALAAYEKKE